MKRWAYLLAPVFVGREQAPAFYRFKLGAIEATVVSDGPIGPLGEPSATFIGAPNYPWEISSSEGIMHAKSSDRRLRFLPIIIT